MLGDSMRNSGNALVKNWPMLACRGGLALALGLAILLRRRPGLGEIVVLFAAYALLDGAAALGWALHASAPRFAWWPVALEGTVSVLLGLVALVWPFLPHRVIELIAAWGVATGVLEILAAVRLPRNLASHWLFGIGGVASIFLGALVWMLPHADTAGRAFAIGVYALAFGVLVSLAAGRLRRHARAVRVELAQSA